ncbi:MAG: lamin tail domain-containing protein [Alphaproteobacteria bacterium]|nr:lamin tail domain-containing protein [Alphaproteobacteria bacterium]
MRSAPFALAFLLACRDTDDRVSVPVPWHGDDDDDDDDVTTPGHTGETPTTEPTTPPPPLEPWSRSEVRTPGSVAITEILFDAGPGDELEWIELTNPAVVSLELTGWSLRGAVDFAFPEGTRIPARGTLVVSSDPSRIPSLGPWTGRLDDDGERIDLFSNGGRRIDSVAYGADDPWPAGADGTGYALAKIRADGPGDRAEAWTVGRRLGGTPGAPNEVDPDAPPVVVPLVPRDATWAFSADPVDPGWADPTYDDSGWERVEAPLYAGPAPAVSATIRFTADNDCAVYLGEADGAGLRRVGDDAAGDWTRTTTVRATVLPTDHLFLAAWEASGSNGGAQMAIAEVELPSGLVGTSADTFDWTLGPPGTAPAVGAAAPPSEAVVSAVAGLSEQLGAWRVPAVEAPPSSAPWGATLGASFDPSTRYVWPDTFGDVSVTNTQDTWALLRSVDPLLDGAATDLGAAPTTARFRVGFTFDGDPARTTLALDCDLDDGAAFTVNGTEVLRKGLPAGPLTDSTLASTEVTGDPGFVATLPGTALVPGDNVLAVEVHQATTDPDEDLRFACAVEARIAPDTLAPPVVLSEVPAAGTEPFRVDLLADHDPGGLVLRSSSGEGWALPALPVGLSAISLDPPPDAGDVLVLAEADGELLDAVRVDERGHARLGDDGPWRVPVRATPGEPNAVAVEDRVAIHEIAYHRAPLDEEGTPFTERPDEWIELFGRGDTPVDLSGWQLVDAVRYTFPEGTVLAPGAYLVVARDAAALRAEVPGIDVVGDFEGSLDNATDRILLRDARGNPVDEVRYADGGRWPSAADGGGSTLERLDPWADGTAAESWAASDESAGAAWTQVVIAGTADPSAVGPDGQWDELVLGLLEEGEVLIDDLSVIRDPQGSPQEMVRNGTFDDADAWRLIGNHRHSRIVPDPDDPSNLVLDLVATGPTEHMHNHAETTLRQRISTVPYVIRFRARWVSGSHLLHSRLYFQRLPRVTRVPRPDTWGTPGRPNGQARAVGPTFSDLRQDVAAPSPGEPVTVSAVVSDPDGVAGVTLWTSVSGGPFAPTPMVTGDGRSWSGVLAGRPAGTVVQFYLQAEDGLGVTADFPAGGPDSRALVRFDDAEPDPGLHVVRLIMTDADSDWMLDPPNLMSNDRLGATVVIDDARVVYDVGVRPKGSERGRPETVRLGYGLQFPRDTPFRGSQRTVLLDRSQGVSFGQREFLLNLVAGRVGLVSAELNDLGWAVTPRAEHTGPVELQIDRLSDLVLDNQYADGADGEEYDYELIYYPLTTDDRTPQGQKLPQPDSVVGTPLTDLGPDPEAWRWTFELQNHEDRDDHEPIMRLGRTFALADPAFSLALDNVIDVDQWLRGFAFATMAGAVDNYGGDGAQHNARFYRRPDDGRMLYFPHDLDFFGSTTMPVFGNADLRRITADPLWRRTYYQHLFDLVDRGFLPAALDADCAEVGALLPAQDFAGNCAQMHARADWVLSGSPDAVLRRYPVVPFAITTNGGVGFSTASAAATLEGDGWIDVRELWWSGSPDPLEVTWLDDRTWQVTVPLLLGPNPVDLTAVDLAGQVVGTDTLVVTRVP